MRKRIGNHPIHDLGKLSPAWGGWKLSRARDHQAAETARAMVAAAETLLTRTTGQSNDDRGDESHADTRRHQHA